MTDPTGLDEATLVWAAVLVTGDDADTVLDDVDLTALVILAAQVNTVVDPIEAAARLLVEIISDRPFRASNTAIGWLSTVEFLRRTGFRISSRPSGTVSLCRAIRRGRVNHARATARLRRWAWRPGVECPTCGRRIYTETASRQIMMAGVTSFELTARCAFEHRSHDRAGRSIPVDRVRGVADQITQPAIQQPVLCRGACGSLLVTDNGRSLVLSPYGDGGDGYRVVEVADVRATDLVGRWDALVNRSETVGLVEKDAVRIDPSTDHLDLARLYAALPPSEGANRRSTRLVGAS